MKFIYTTIILMLFLPIFPMKTNSIWEIDEKNSQLTNFETLKVNSETDKAIIKLLDQKLPYKIKNFGIGSNGSHIFTFGGTSDSWHGLSSIYAINVNNFSKFQLVGRLIQPNYNMGCVQIRNKVYLIGGVNIGVESNLIECFNLETMELQPVNVSLPMGLEIPKVEAINDKIYIFGGISVNRVRSDKIFVLDTNNNTLTEADAKIPKNYLHFSVFPNNDEIYLLGGIYEKTNTVTNEIWIFNPINETLIKSEKTLSFPLLSYHLITTEDALYSFCWVGTNELHNDLLEIDRDNFSINVIKTNIFSSLGKTLLVKNAFYDDFYLYSLGGTLENDYLATDFVFRIKILSNNNDTILNEPFNGTNWEVNNTDSFNFNYSESRLDWSFDSKYGCASTAINRTVKTDDCMELEIKYLSHYDDNSRQRIIIGFTNSTPIVKINYFNNIPNHNFVGIVIQNFVINNENKVRFAFVVGRNGSVFNYTDVYMTRNKVHNIRLHVCVINSTHFKHSFIIDSESFSREYINYGNLQGMELNQFAIWNKNASVLGPQGEYTGQVTFARYRQNVEQMHINSWIPAIINQESSLSSSQVTSSIYEDTQETSDINNDNIIIAFSPEIVIMLLFVFVLGITGFVVVSKTKLKYYIYNKDIDDPIVDIIPSPIFNFYIKLKETFNRLELIKQNLIEDIDKTGNEEDTLLPSFFNFSSPITVSEMDFSGISGTALNIMLYLLEKLDQGTYQSTIQVDLDIKRSTLHYNLKVLEEHGLITKIRPLSSNHDMRYKIVVITDKGKNLLYYIYKKLDMFFNS